MNRYAMLHIVDSSYCFPISGNELVVRLRAAKGDLVQAKVVYESKYIIGMKQKTKEMTKAYSSELFDFFEVTIKQKDMRLGYVFLVNDGQKEYYFSEDGVTETYDFTLGFYNFFQYPYINEADIMECVPWMKKAVFYQIFVDRFYQGNHAKDESYINCTWGDVPTPFTHAGGDLRGIIDKLDYLQKLGINAIYLTPIFQAYTNHKYDTVDYYEIDKQFGSKEDLKELVATAHAKGIRIVLDAVFNHCCMAFAPFQDVKEKGKASEYFDWFIIHGDSVKENGSNYETFASCKYMPKFNTSNPKVQEYLTGIATYYIREFDIDGWRLDVADEVSHQFWRIFREAVKKEKKDAIILGENWHDSSANLRGDQYDGIMNYAFTKTCLDYFATGTMDAEHTAWKLNDLLMRNKRPANQMMLNLLDSHDTHRFFKEVQKNRFHMKAALCLLYLFPGAPCIFYGTEILTWGGYDPDCRRCMDWSRTGIKGDCADVYTLLQSLAKLRKKYNWADGQISITSEKNVLVLKIENGKNELCMLINLDKEKKTAQEIGVEAESVVIRVNGGEIIHV